MSQIQVAFPTSDEVYLESDDVLLEGDDLARMADSQLIERVVRYLDRPDSDFAGMIVTRPSTANVLIAPKPVYGGVYSGERAVAVIGAIIGLGFVYLMLVVAPLLHAIGGYFGGWVLRDVFPFAGQWVSNGAAALGL